VQNQRGHNRGKDVSTLKQFVKHFAESGKQAIPSRLCQHSVVFPISHLSIGFLTLIALMNRMRGAIPDTSYSEDFLFSSA
jgi:hypothetical protein